MSEGGREGRAARAWLLAAMVLGLVRWWRLGDWSLWIDEAYTLADAHRGGGNYNPLAYWLVRTTVAGLGGAVDETALRWLPATAGWLSIPLTAWAFSPLAGGRRASQAALLVALSSWQVSWSQTARFYTPVQAVVLLGTGLLVRGMVGGSAVSACIGIAVVGAGVALHLQAALVAGALGGALALLVVLGPRLGVAVPPGWRRVARPLVALALVAGLAGSPWALGIFQDYRHTKGAPSLASVAHLAKGLGFYLTPVVVVAAGVGALAAARRRDPAGLLLTGVVVLGLGAVAGAASLAQGSAQYAFALFPFVALLALWPLGCEPLAHASGPRLAYLALLALPLATGTGLYFSPRQGERPRWREAYAWVEDRRGPRDLVLGMQAPVGEFTLDPRATDLHHPRVVAWSDRTRPRAWVHWARGERPLWIVVRPEFWQLWPPGARRDLQAFLGEECRLARRFEVALEGRDLDVEVYRRR